MCPTGSSRSRRARGAAQVPPAPPTPSAPPRPPSAVRWPHRPAQRLSASATPAQPDRGQPQHSDRDPPVPHPGGRGGQRHHRGRVVGEHPGHGCPATGSARSPSDVSGPTGLPAAGRRHWGRPRRPAARARAATQRRHGAARCRRRSSPPTSQLGPAHRPRPPAGSQALRVDVVHGLLLSWSRRRWRRGAEQPAGCRYSTPISGRHPTAGRQHSLPPAADDFDRYTARPGGTRCPAPHPVKAVTGSVELTRFCGDLVTADLGWAAAACAVCLASKAAGEI